MTDTNETPSAGAGNVPPPSLETLSAGQLPSTALPKSIDFTYLELNTPYAKSPIVYFPFSAAPSGEDVKAVAEHFARFVAEQTGEPAIYVSEVLERGVRFEGEQFEAELARYLEGKATKPPYCKISRTVRSLAADERKRRAHSYHVTPDSSTAYHSPEIKAVIQIYGEPYSGAETALALEAYVEKVRAQQ